MRGVVVLAGVAACNPVFGIDETHLIDARLCTPVTSDFDDFEQPAVMPCSWGYLTQQGCAAAVASGELTMTSAANNASTVCVCGTNTPMAFTSTFGVMAEMHEIASQPGEYTELVAVDAGGSGEAWSFASIAGSPMVAFQHKMTRLATVPFDASSRWWRIRPDATGTAVIGEVSSGGHSWMIVATDPATPPAMVKFAASNGTYAAVAAPSTTRVASINVCP